MRFFSSLPRHLVWLLIFLSTALHAESDTTLDLINRYRVSGPLLPDLVWKQTHNQNSNAFASRLNAERPFCSDGSIGIFWNSSHPGGNPYGVLNERNRGLWIECPLSKYLNELVHTHGKIGGVHNSQFGSTFLMGGGLKLVTPEFFYARLAVGGEIHFITYEHPRKRLVLRGFLPVGTAEISFRIGSYGELQLVQHSLSDTGVKLYARRFVINRSF